MVFSAEGVWLRNRHDALLREVAAQNGIAVSEVNLGIRLASGEWQAIEAPEVEDEDVDDFPDESWPDWENSSDLKVSTAGFEHLRRLLTNGFRIPSFLQPRLLPLLQANLYDTAIREVALHLEVAMKGVLTSSGYQRDVAGRYITHLQQSGRFLTAWVRWHEVEVRTAMKWVRNEFAHNIIDVEPAHSYALLSRLCELVATVDEVAQALRNPA